MELMTRLDKTGTRFLCGMLDCGASLAWALEPNATHLGGLWFPPGWSWRKDGLWVFSRRGDRRLRKGQPPQARRWFANQDVAGPIGWLAELSRPVRARCYVCGMIQEFDRTAPAVARHPRPVVDDDRPAMLRPLLSEEELARWERERPRL